LTPKNALINTDLCDLVSEHYYVTSGVSMQSGAQGTD